MTKKNQALRRQKIPKMTTEILDTRERLRMM